MYLKKAYNSKTGRTYLSIVHGYWDPQKKQSRTDTVQKVGYLDELEGEYEDPIAHYTEVAKQMNAELKESDEVSVSMNTAARISNDDSNRKNYGHIVLSKIYHELEINRFLKNARRHENFKFNTDAIMRLLVFSRILNPCSKKATVMNKDIFFDNFNFSLDDVYNSLTHFDSIANALERHLHEQVSCKYGRTTDLIYYDVTNYYFETDIQDEMRKNGASKQNRKKPIVQMGLLMDNKGLPISYRLFPGNTHDSQTLMPMLTDVKKKYGVNRIIVVADKGLNSGDNIAYSTITGDGYIYSKSVRGASAEFKEWVLDETDYRHVSDNYKIKSRIIPDAEIKVTTAKNGKKKQTKTVKLEQKQVVYFSEKYAQRAKHKREETIRKAMAMIENPSKYKRSIDYGAAGYIENIKIDKETSEIINTDDTLFLDESKIAEEEKYDGYYALITSELDDTDEHIREMYRGLWKIEESFKISKSVFNARPVFVRTPEHINAHFLVCFIALLISRILESKLDHKYSIKKIKETLGKVECSHIAQNYWLFDYVDKITDDMNKVFEIDFGKKIMTLEEIRKNLGMVKNG